MPAGPERVAENVTRIVAPNAGPYTGSGTNTYLVGEAQCVVVDPGPDHEGHHAAIRAALARRKPVAILLTHTHRDHSGSAPALKAELGVPLWFGGRHRLSRPALPFETNGVRRASQFDLVPDRVLEDGERLSVGDLTIEAIATPGHCANHFAFGIMNTDVLLSGDHVMGWSSTLVSVPDGSMDDYFASLDRLSGLPYRLYLPGHGDAVTDGPARVKDLRAHRLKRDEEIVGAIAAGRTTIGGIVAAIYPDLALKLVPAARMTVKAHLEHLARSGRIGLRRTPFGLRARPR